MVDGTAGPATAVPPRHKVPADLAQDLRDGQGPLLQAGRASGEAVSCHRPTGQYVAIHDGQVVADGATHDLLTDHELMRRHRLELPLGFDPATIPGIGNLRGLSARPAD